MHRAISRRDLGRLALAAAPLAMATPWRAFAAARPTSRIAGVQIGAISGSFAGVPPEQLIAAILKTGLTEMELTSATVEALAGSPVPAATRGPDSPTLNADGLQPRCAGLPMVPPLMTTGGEWRAPAPPPTAEQVAAQQASQQRLNAWRATTTPETWRAVRRRFDEAGIQVRVLWYGLGFGAAVPPEDAEMDYAFRMAKGLGVESVSGSSFLPIVPRINAAATRHGMTWAGHTQDNIHNPDQFATPEAYAKLLQAGRNLRICLDVGYFTAAGFDSVAFLEKNHRSITDIHLKDRKRSKSLGGDVTHNLVNNWPFGQGDAPIKEVLQLLKKKRWDIPVQIEYDYGCRTTNDSVTEITRCYEYCRNALES